MKRYWLLLFGLFAALSLALAGCGGGGSGGVNADRDGDGIPNVDDAFPDDPTRFAAFTQVDLTGLQGVTFSSAVAINDAGVIVGTSNDIQGDVHAVVWSVTGTTATPAAHLESPAHGAGITEFSAALGVNNFGDAVGESNNAAGGRDAIFWLGIQGTPTSASPVILPPLAGALFSAAYDINNAKRIVGESQQDGVTRAVTWAVNAAGEPGEAVLLDEPPSSIASSAYFIDESNRTVGEYATSGGLANGILWTLGPGGAVTGMVPLPPLPGDLESVAYSINDGGRIVGESISATGDVRGVTWTVAGSPAVATPEALGTPGEGNALAINDSGRIAGWSMASDANAIATVWDQRNLALADAFLAPTAFSQGFGTNNNGDIVGMADNSAFVAVSQ